MAELVLHPDTEKQLQSFITKPTHALLLIGSEGIGKQTITTYLLRQLLGIETDEALESYPYLIRVIPEKESISIETIRELQHGTKLKVPVSATVRWRIVYIEQAEHMTKEAQNALLKLLEEPPLDTIFLLTVVSDQVLLPTIRSRVQHISIQQPSAKVLNAYFLKQGYSERKIQQAYLLSGGLPGLMHALLKEDDAHYLTKSVTEARALLQATTFERLSMVDALAKQRTEIVRILFVLQQMAHAALTQSVGKDSKEAIRSITRWQHILAAAYEAEKSLAANAQAKLVLTNLLLNL